MYGTAFAQHLINGKIYYIYDLHDLHDLDRDLSEVRRHTSRPRFEPLTDRALHSNLA